jgi:putative flippase GtrA
MPRFSPGSLGGGAFPRFALVGGLCFGLNLALLYLAVEIAHLHYLLASALCLWVVTGVGFFLNRRWTFSGSGTNFWPQLSRYYTVSLGRFFLNVGIIAFLVDVLHIHYLVSNIGLGIGLTLVNFWIQKNWTFKFKPTSHDSNEVV